MNSGNANELNFKLLLSFCLSIECWYAFRSILILLYENGDAEDSIVDVMQFPVDTLVLLMLVDLINSRITNSSNLSILKSVVQSFGSVLSWLLK